jgi:hypothetical protein
VQNVEGNAVARLARFADVECRPLDGLLALDGNSAVLFVRPAAPVPAGEIAESLAEAASLGVPVVVVAGSRDGEGSVLLREAALCGIPPECVLLVEGGKIVDASGRVVGDALRGRGIGITVAVRAAREALEKGLVPEPAVWEESGAEEPAVWESVAKENGEKNERVVEEDGIKHPIEDYFDAARHAVAVFGIKPNVGASTVAACLAGVLDDYDPLYLEAAPSLAGYRYFALDVESAVRTGKYAPLSRGGASGAPRPCGVLVAEVSASEGEAADIAYRRAGCRVLVTDGSPVSFERVGAWVKGGGKFDVLVVNRVLPGAGYPPEVYTGEYNLERVFGIPGGFEEEAAVNAALQSGTLPLGRSPDFDNAVGYFARAVLEVLGMK